MKDLKHSIQNLLNNIVEHITSPRIWTFTVLQSLALHTAGQRPLEGSYGGKSADRTKPYFDVTFFVFLSSCFGNLEVGYAKTVNIF